MGGKVSRTVKAESGAAFELGNRRIGRPSHCRIEGQKAWHKYGIKQPANQLEFIQDLKASDKTSRENMGLGECQGRCNLATA